MGGELKVLGITGQKLVDNPQLNNQRSASSNTDCTFRHIVKYDEGVSMEVVHPAKKES